MDMVSHRPNLGVVGVIGTVMSAANRAEAASLQDAFRTGFLLFIRHRRCLVQCKNPARC
jgi:hypothetical protein